MPGGPLPTDVDPPWDQVLVCAGQAAQLGYGLPRASYS